MTSPHAAPLPVLACRPPKLDEELEAATSKPCRDMQHSEAEWAAIYPHIQRLYIHQRRKLRYVMRHMEEKYSFHATPQMYKNRFAKWGLYKSRRRVHAVSTASQLSNRTMQPSIPSVPGPAPIDMANLMFLTSTRTWSSAFFEAVGQSHTPSTGTRTPLSLLLPHKKHTELYDAEQTSFSFKLIAGLLGRDEGLLAGRLARKVFLQIEEILLLEGPLLIWNLIEILHSILQFKQVQLFEMLLIHLLRLARSHYSDNHSIVQMLHSLWGLCKAHQSGTTDQLLQYLEQGWLLNAEILLGNLDERFLLLYYRLIWDSVLIKLVRDKLRDTDAWFSLIIKKIPIEAMEEGAEHIYPAEKIMLDTSCAPPQDYEIIKTESIGTIYERTGWDFPDPSSRFRVLSALIKSRILDDKEGNQDKLSSHDTNDIHDASPDLPVQVQTNIPRLHARILAYVIKVIMEIDKDNRVSNVAIIEKLNSIIALREYGQGAAIPQVICEMWQLQELLMQENRCQEASQVEKEAQRRLEQYLRDIP